jgi:prepilin-type N-terminal cleavage/methylation domain-containing protein
MRTVTPTRRTRGFSLVELMVALALGLIVTVAVIALVVSIIRSNRQTLQSTRLNQELRATLSVIANDLKRARSVDDPLGASALTPASNPYRWLDTDTQAGCMIYGYAGALDGPWHILRLENGRIMLEGVPGDPKPANCDPDGDATPIGSEQVEITALQFDPPTTTNNPPDLADRAYVRKITVTITGHLIDDDRSLAQSERTMSQEVYVRSVGTGI